MWACEHGHIEVVELLIQHKASINLKAKVCNHIMFLHQGLNSCIHNIITSE